MDVPAHDLTRTIDCQVVGCDQAAEPGALVCRRHESSAAAGKRCRLGCGEPVTGRYSRGPLANLCEVHEQERRGGLGRPAAASGEPGVRVAGSFAAKTKALVPLAKKLDSAIARQEREKGQLRRQRSQLEQRERVADQDVAAALSEWRRALQALAG